MIVSSSVSVACWRSIRLWVTACWVDCCCCGCNCRCSCCATDEDAVCVEVADAVLDFLRKRKSFETAAGFECSRCIDCDCSGGWCMLLLIIALLWMFLFPLMLFDGRGSFDSALRRRSFLFTPPLPVRFFAVVIQFMAVLLW